MPSSTGPGALLLPQGAFVVQFRTDADLARERYTGRVEHVVSGQAMHFQSREELLGFMAQVLRTVHVPSSDLCHGSEAP